MVKVTAITQEEVDNCPIRQVLSQVLGKWQMLLLLTLDDGPQRFGALKRGLGDITQRVLTENLRKLERDGYLTRHVDPGPPIAVTYELTDMGLELARQLMGLVVWAKTNHPDVVHNRAAYDDR